MSYREAFIRLYGATGAALDYLEVARVETREHSEAMAVLKKALAEVEEMIETGELDGEDE